MGWFDRLFPHQNPQRKPPRLQRTRQLKYQSSVKGLKERTIKAALRSASSKRSTIKA
jgi:hypothetical protein